MIVANKAKNELFLDGVIGADWTGEGITAMAVSDALDSLDGARATVRINSPGGSADEGIAIYNVLKRYQGGIDTVNEALAASAASVVFLAGETRIMSSGSRIMIHRALTIEIGNADRMRKTADVLEAYDKSLVEIYSNYMSDSEESIMALLSAETWYNADNAVSSGLATAKSERKTKAKAAMAAWFKHPPEDIALQCHRRELVKSRLAFANLTTQKNK
jgi:ATP-dependent Clp protease protease subunit